MTRWTYLPGEKPPRKRRRAEEDQLHIKIVWRLKQDYPDLLVIHPANGGKRSKREASKLKAMGVLAGTPDLLLWWNDSFEYDNCVVHLSPGKGAIELKTEKGRLSPEQKAWRDRFFALGGKWAVCRSYEEVRFTLQEWGVRP